MNSRFPHISQAEGFPDLPDAWPPSNAFDYTQWTPDTRVRLVRVPWNNRPPYNAVAFEDDAARDKYLNSLKGETVELIANTRADLEGRIKLPVPFDVANLYNYAIVDFPAAPVPYEQPQSLRRYCFFIEGVEGKGAPNMTAVRISVDWWTTAGSRMNLNYMMLERGHAPVAASKLDSYLANPLENSALLLAPDASYGDAVRVASADFVPLMNAKAVCAAFSMTWDQLGALTMPGAPGEFTSAVYSDNPARWGEDYEISGYEWGGVGDYSEVKTPAGSTFNASTVGGCMVQIEGDAAAFFEKLNDSYPQAFAAIQAVFVLDPRMFEVTGARTWTMRDGSRFVVNEIEDSGTRLLKAIELTADDFGYPENIKKFTKLYTFPYAALEVTDGEQTKVVKIETTGALQLEGAAALAYPYLKYQTFLNGVGGSGSTSFEWQAIGGATGRKDIPNSDFTEYLWKFDIPTFSLFQDGYTAWQLHNANNTKAANRYLAVKDYHNAARSANTALQNANDAADVSKTSADASANTALANANRATSTAQGNANRSAEAAKTSGDASADAAKTMNENANTLTNEVAANDRAIASTNTVTNTASAAAVTNLQNKLAEAQKNWDIGYNEAMKKLEITTDAISGIANAAGQVLSGNPAGGIGTGITTVVGAFKSQLAYQAATDNANNKYDSSALNATQIQKQINDTNELTNDQSNDTSEKNTNLTIAASEANAVISRDTAKANNERAYNTAVANAAASADTSNTNNAAANATALANNERAQAIAKANARYSRDASVLNAQAQVDASQAGATFQIADRRNDSAVTVGTASGDPTPDMLAWRGIQIRVKTQTAGAIAQAAGAFARWGYALGQPWAIASRSDLVPMANFSYWQCSDLWITPGAGIIEEARDAVRAMFMEGVTFWRDPEKLGKVNVYDNFSE